MKNKKYLQIIAGVTFSLVILLVSFYGGTYYNRQKTAKDTEQTILQQTFIQQYGSDATIKQIVSPTKVYAAAWTSKDGTAHISWNIGGLWVTDYDGTAPSSATTTPASSPTP